MPKGRSAARSAGGFAGYKAPSVPPSEGDLVDGESFVISGSGFGTKSTAAPELFDRCYYSALSDGDAIPIFSPGEGYPWPNTSYYGGRIYYETTDTRRDGSVGQYKALNTTEAILAELPLSATGKLYVSWWAKWDKNYQQGTHSSKILRVSNSGNITGETFSWTQDHIYTSPSEIWGYSSNFAPTADTWAFYEAWFDTATDTFYCRVNGAIAWGSGAGDLNGLNFDYLWKVGWDGGGTTPLAMDMRMDDIYVDSSLARVMLGNASTYAACTAFEMQPATSWSGTSITVTANKGAMSAGTAYLYVIDSTGALVNSSGYSVTVS